MEFRRLNDKEIENLIELWRLEEYLAQIGVFQPKCCSLKTAIISEGINGIKSKFEPEAETKGC